MCKEEAKGFDDFVVTSLGSMLHGLVHRSLAWGCVKCPIHLILTHKNTRACLDFIFLIFFSSRGPSQRELSGTGIPCILKRPCNIGWVHCCP